MNDDWVQTTLGDCLDAVSRPVDVAQIAEVPFAGVRWYAGGVYARQSAMAADVKTKRLFRIEQDDVTYNRMWATKAAFGVVGEEAHGYLVTNDFPTFVATERVLPEFLRLVFATQPFQQQAERLATGTTERRRLHQSDFLAIRISLPPLGVQRRIVDMMEHLDTHIANLETEMALATKVHSDLRSLLLGAWDQAPLGEFVSIDAQLVDPCLEHHRHLPHVGIDRIEKGSARLLPLQSAEQEGVTSSKYLFTECDVIYSKIRPNLRKVAFPGFRGLCSADAYPLTPKRGLPPELLVEVLLLDAVVEQVEAKSGRTKMPKINREQLWSVTVPLLSPDEAEDWQHASGMLAASRDAIEALRRELACAQEIRRATLRALVGGQHDIPDSYDALLESV